MICYVRIQLYMYVRHVLCMHYACMSYVCRESHKCYLTRTSVPIFNLYNYFQIIAKNIIMCVHICVCERTELVLKRAFRLCAFGKLLLLNPHLGIHFHAVLSSFEQRNCGRLSLRGRWLTKRSSRKKKSLCTAPSPPSLCRRSRGQWHIVLKFRLNQ